MFSQLLDNLSQAHIFLHEHVLNLSLYMMISVFQTPHYTSLGRHKQADCITFIKRQHISECYIIVYSVWAMCLKTVISAICTHFYL